MLSELLTSLMTRCPDYVRHMDYLYEVIAMRGRFRRNEESWRPHLDHTRQFVLSSAERCRRRNKVVIIGAGLLLDLPVRELSSLFREVVLLDVVLLPEVRRIAAKFGNVRLIQHDATNMARRLYENGHRGIHELPRSSPAIDEIDRTTDLVVSLNILSQLWVIPRQYALKKIRGLDEEEVDDWCSRIVESHMAFLRALPCSVAVVGDYEFVRRDRELNIVSRGSTVYGIALPEPDVSWTWQIAPLGEERNGLSKELTVGAWRFRL